MTSEKPLAAVAGEWNTNNLGDHAIFEGVTDFLRVAGFESVPIAFGSLRVAAPPQPGSAGEAEGSTTHLPRYLRGLAMPAYKRLQGRRLDETIAACDLV